MQEMLQDYPSAVMLITVVMAFLMTGPMLLIEGKIGISSTVLLLSQVFRTLDLKEIASP